MPALDKDLLWEFQPLPLSEWSGGRKKSFLMETSCPVNACVLRKSMFFSLSHACRSPLASKEATCCVSL